MNSRFSKQVSFFVFSCLLSASISNAVTAVENITLDDLKTKISKIQEKEALGQEINSYEQKVLDVLKAQSEKKDNQKTSNLTMAERTALKSLVATLVGVSKEKLKTKYKKHLFLDPKEQIVGDIYQIDTPDIYSLAKTYLDLLVDEFVPKDQTTKAQALIELIVPIVVSVAIVDYCYKFQGEQKLTTKNLEKLLSDVITKVFEKFVIVRFLQKPGTSAFKYADIYAMVYGFINYKTPTIIDFERGTKKFGEDRINWFVTNKMDLGKTLNPKHRKKAIAKTAQYLGRPLIQLLLQSLKNSSN